MHSDKLALVAIVSVLALCVPAHAGKDAREPIIEIVPGRGEEPWTATYRFPGAIERLTFERSASHFREGSWKVVQGDYEFVRAGDDEILKLRPDGEPSAVIAIQFPIHTEILEKEYEFFRRFTDGGLLMYTGHFYATAQPVEATSTDGLAVQRLAMEPRPGERLLINGETHRERLTWHDEDGQGTFVYFGNQPPVESDVMMAVLDPGLPDWLRGRFEELLPPLFEFYEKRTDTKLRFRPMIFFSFEEAEIPGTDWSGGVLPGTIQLHAKGNEWNRESPSTLAGVFQFLAHEAAHLWNGEMYLGSSRIQVGLLAARRCMKALFVNGFRESSRA